MYVLDYLLYHLRPYGINSQVVELAQVAKSSSVKSDSPPTPHRITEANELSPKARNGTK
jgi:hypothetical protein